MKCDEFNSSSVEFTILGHLKQSNIKPPPLIGAIQKTTLDSKVKFVTEGKKTFVHLNWQAMITRVCYLHNINIAETIHPRKK